MKKTMIILMGCCAVTVFLSYNTEPAQARSVTEKCVVEPGGCMMVTVKLTVESADKNKPNDVWESKKGCRCFYKINGIEMIPTTTMPDMFCDPEKLKEFLDKNKKKPGKYDETL